MPPDRFFPSLIDCCLFLTGPTASGKTAVGLELASNLQGEILSLDSIAVYRMMDIGTAKPSQADRERVPHHLLDLAEADEEFSISQFLHAAHARVAEIRQREKLPVFVGGTPLYLKALLRGFFVGPPADWEFRQAIERDVQVHGTEMLHQRLQQVDPLAAHRLPQNDVRRITRALEVAKITGRPLSHWQIQFERTTPAERCKMFSLRLPKEIQTRRIERRVDKMFADGLVDEVKGLIDRFGDRISRTAMQGVGYREVARFLRGEATLEETMADVKLHTVQMAKRQRTWLRSLEEVRFVDIDDDDPPESIAQRIMAMVTNCPAAP
jgi:tRNA dimethylallyltransferase